MPLLLVYFCRCISLTLKSVYMHYNRFSAVLYLFKCLNKSCNIVAPVHIHIVKSHSLKQIAFCLTVSLSKQSKILIETSMIFSNRHIVVIYYNNKIALKLSSKIKSLKCFSSA